LKTLVDVTRAVFGVYPKHISGDIVVRVDTPAKVGSPPVQQQAMELLVQSTAEAALGQVNPYVLAAYWDDHREYEKSIEIVERIIQDPAEDILHKSAACSLCGLVLYEQKRSDEAIAKFQKAIELDPKLALAYNNWGSVLDNKGKYDEAIAKFRKAIELDPKLALAYNNWGIVLRKQGKNDEAEAKFQKAIELSGSQ